MQEYKINPKMVKKMAVYLKDNKLFKNVFQRHANVSSIKIIQHSSGCIRIAITNY